MCSALQIITWKLFDCGRTSIRRCWSSGGKGGRRSAVNANAIAILIHMRNPNEDVKSRTNERTKWEQTISWVYRSIHSRGAEEGECSASKWSGKDLWFILLCSNCVHTRRGKSLRYCILFLRFEIVIFMILFVCPQALGVSGGMVDSSKNIMILEMNK